MVKRGATKRAVGVCVALMLLAVNFSPRVQSLRTMPNILYMGEGQIQILDFIIPLKAEVEGNSVDVVSGKDETLSDVGAAIQSNNAGTSNIRFSILGVPVKEIQVQVTPTRKLIPGGQAVGVAMMTQGVYIVGSEAVHTYDGREANPARVAGIFPGDSILSVNGTPTKSFDDLRNAVEKCKGEQVIMRISRDGEEMVVSVQPEKDQRGTYRLGVWARDSTAGVGTLTFVDPQNQTFGALGHAITDSDTGRLLPVRDGSVFSSSIVGIQRGQQGQPGELRGIFSTDTPVLGSIEKNTDFGIYGKVSDGFAQSLYPEGLPIATQAMVTEGPAQILSMLDDEGVKAYDCRIVKISRQGAPATRSMVIEVTDEELLKRTGGIVQGMSGSPIIQDGHIVGAVTHVYVNDPTRGYGLFIEWMLAAQDT